MNNKLFYYKIIKTNLLAPHGGNRSVTQIFLTPQPAPYSYRTLLIMYESNDLGAIPNAHLAINSLRRQQN